MGLAATSGQLIGGVLIRSDLGGLGWRAIFWINVPLGVAALLACPRLVPESRAGQGLCITPLTTTVLSHAGPASAGSVSGALSTAQQVGNSIGVAVTGVLFFGALGHGYGLAFERSVLQMGGLLLVVVALTRLMPGRQRNA